MAADDQPEAIAQLFCGARVRSVGRAASMGIVELDSMRDRRILIHIQCAFRVIHAGKIILGCRDMRYPERGAGERAFDEFSTIFDARATTLNRVLGELRVAVSDVTIGSSGELVLIWGEFRLEVFPDCSGSVEAWRVFEKGGEHRGFPAHVV